MLVRIKFSKHGLMKYIGHLDLMRYFQRTARMAGLPMAYSEGFSPHPLLSFAQPLSVGLESNGEYVDMKLKDFMSTDNIRSRLHNVQAEGMDIEAVAELPEKSKKAMASVAYASYYLQFRPGRIPDADMGAALEQFFSLENYPVEKATKKGSREIDLRSLTRSAVLHEGSPERGSSFPVDNGAYLELCLSAESGDNVKPEFFLQNVLLLSGQGPYENLASDILVTRQELYDSDMRPLIEAGKITK